MQIGHVKKIKKRELSSTMGVNEFMKVFNVETF